MMGQSANLGVLVVVHCYRPEVPLSEFFRPDGPELKNNNPFVRKSMRKEYDFLVEKPNPYVKRLKKAVTIRLEPDVITHFKAFLLETHIAYQNLINLYLLDCAREHRKISLKWEVAALNSTP
jgi:uncharacterized protein (DUF4415 family)